MTEPDPVRPRYGVVRHADGTTTMVTFLPSELKDTFRMVNAGTEEPVTMHEGETFQVLGAMTEDQAILYQMSGDTNERVGKLSKRKKGAPVATNDDKKKSPWTGLAMLFALGGFVLFMVWGVDAILN